MAKSLNGAKNPNETSSWQSNVVRAITHQETQELSKPRSLGSSKAPHAVSVVNLLLDIYNYLVLETRCWARGTPHLSQPGHSDKAEDGLFLSLF